MNLRPALETITSDYLRHRKKKIILLVLTAIVTCLVAIMAISKGAYPVPLKDLWEVFTGTSNSTARVVITNIRLPRIISAIICGWSLSLSGLTIQSLLKNPLGSPSTLGISQGAAFGASAAIVVFGAEM